MSVPLTGVSASRNGSEALAWMVTDWPRVRAVVSSLSHTTAYRYSGRRSSTSKVTSLTMSRQPGEEPNGGREDRSAGMGGASRGAQDEGGGLEVESHAEAGARVLRLGEACRQAALG